MPTPRPESDAIVTQWLLDIPVWLVVVACLTLGLAPFTPEPHLVEKLRLLADGRLTAPVDVGDLLLHAAPWILLVLRLLLPALGSGDQT